MGPVVLTMEPRAGGTVKTRGDRMTAACALCNSISSQNLQISRFLLKKDFTIKR